MIGGLVSGGLGIGDRLGLGEPAGGRTARGGHRGKGLRRRGERNRCGHALRPDGRPVGHRRRSPQRGNYGQD